MKTSSMLSSLRRRSWPSWTSVSGHGGEGDEEERSLISPRQTLNGELQLAGFSGT